MARSLAGFAILALLLGGCHEPARLVLDRPALQITDPAGARFAGGKRLLEGFDEFRPDGAWAPGDSILLGIAMDSPRISREWYLRATALEQPVITMPDGTKLTRADSVRVRYTGKEQNAGAAWVRVDYNLVPVRVELFDSDGTMLSGSLASMPEICLRYGMIDNIELERSGRTFYDSIAPPEDGGELVAGKEQMRFLAGWLALMKFPAFLHRDSMQDVLWQLIERPSLLSILARRGVSLSLSMDAGDAELVEPPPMGLPAPVYRVPLEIKVNGSAAMDCELLLARTVPPLGPCNGLVALEAVNPRDGRKRISVRLLAARNIPPTKSGEPPNTRPAGHPTTQPAAASPAGSGP